MKPEIEIALERVRSARSILDLEARSLKQLRSQCKHTIIPSDPEDEESSDGICGDCGFETGSWYCPNNAPSHECSYTEGECCVHCHNPSERL